MGRSLSCPAVCAATQRCAAQGRPPSSQYMHAEQQICARAHFIVLTENAVGFENGGQCFSSNRETYPLYVSKKKLLPPRYKLKQKTLTEKRNLLCNVQRRSCGKRLLLRLASALSALKTWCFSWLCDTTYIAHTHTLRLQRLASV